MFLVGWPDFCRVLLVVHLVDQRSEAREIGGQNDGKDRPVPRTISVESTYAAQRMFELL